MAATVFRSFRFLPVSSRRSTLRWLATPTNKARCFSLTQYLRDTERRYTRSHEWATLSKDTLRVGVSHHAQDTLGEVVYVDLPEVGEVLGKEDVCGTVESVKAAADIYTPLAGTIKTVNEELSDNPSLINESPTEKGWIVELTVEKGEQLNELMTEEEYRKFLEEDS